MGREDARALVDQISLLLPHRQEKPENPAQPLILQQEAETFLGGRTGLGSHNKCMIEAVGQGGCLPLRYTEVLMQSMLPFFLQDVLRAQMALSLLHVPYPLGRQTTFIIRTRI